MGFRVSYIVTPVLPRELVTTLGFGLDIETDALPYDEWWVGTLKSTNMTVFWSEAEDFVNGIGSELAELSRHAPVYVCTVNETVMHSKSICYRDGVRIWQVEWSGELGPSAKNLNTIGSLPAAYDELVEKKKGLQIADSEIDHFFEVPLELVAAAGGFRHDLDLMNKNFTRFFRITAETKKAVQATKPGILQRIFGR